METMSECKVGNKAKILRITGGYRGKFNVGDVAVIKEFESSGSKFVRMDGENNIRDSWHNINNIELVEPKWTIYNNEKAWEDLSDKQKGKLLLAAHEKVEFKNVYHKTPKFDCKEKVYTAIKPELIMADLFFADWIECKTRDVKMLAEHMIAKGWTKPCK
jgi:hypothetical protein